MLSMMLRDWGLKKPDVFLTLVGSALAFDMEPRLEQVCVIRSKLLSPSPTLSHLSSPSHTRASSR